MAFFENSHSSSISSIPAMFCIHLNFFLYSLSLYNKFTGSTSIQIHATDTSFYHSDQRPRTNLEGPFHHLKVISDCQTNCIVPLGLMLSSKAGWSHFDKTLSSSGQYKSRTVNFGKISWSSFFSTLHLKSPSWASRALACRYSDSRGIDIVSNSSAKTDEMINIDSYETFTSLPIVFSKSSSDTSKLSTNGLHVSTRFLRPSTDSRSRSSKSAIIWFNFDLASLCSWSSTERSFR